jgi:hypothetical protein
MNGSIAIKNDLRKAPYRIVTIHRRFVYKLN